MLCNAAQVGVKKMLQYGNDDEAGGGGGLEEIVLGGLTHLGGDELGGTGSATCGGGEAGDVDKVGVGGAVDGGGVGNLDPGELAVLAERRQAQMDEVTALEAIFADDGEFTLTTDLDQLRCVLASCVRVKSLCGSHALLSCV